MSGEIGRAEVLGGAAQPSDQPTVDGLVQSPSGDPGHRAPARRRWERGPFTDWRPWTAPAALAGAFVLALIGGLIVEIPAQMLEAHITPSHVPGGVELAATVAQDVAFVLVALFFAQLGGRALGVWQLGLRPPRTDARRVVALVAATIGAFLLFGAVWSLALPVHEKEKLLETLGANEGTTLLLLSAALTCVVAPIGEEILFRGYVFGALCNWRGPWPAALVTGVLFGAVHAGSAPAVDLVPLAVLGFLLCLLYRATGSLYPCLAVHALNNAVAFGELESWGLGEVVALIAATAGMLTILGGELSRRGLIGREPAPAEPDGMPRVDGVSSA
ncbi:MAG: CPBP family intramembrane metalloprotease [Acidobacteriota bacterium]|nr:CPBP family intramembrane metalloprotease [Acidobacteriota bacterium]